MTGWGRQRLTAHEAAHACACVLLGREVQLVRTTTNPDGIASVHHRPTTMLELDPDCDLGGQAFLLPPDLRRRIEEDIVITLVGGIAELAFPAEFSGGYLGEDAEEQEMEWRLRARLGLPPAAAEIAERDDRLEFTHEPDEDKAWRYATVAAPDTAGAYLAWLRAEADVFVRSLRFRRAFAAVYPALLEAGELSGDVVHELVDNATTRRVPNAAASDAYVR